VFDVVAAFKLVNENVSIKDAPEDNSLKILPLRHLYLRVRQ